MIRTLLLYDGKMSSAERMAEQLCYMIGNARAADIEHAPEDLSPYGGFCFVFNFYGTVTTGKTLTFLKTHSGELKGKRLVMVGIGYSDLGYSRYVVDTEKETGLEGISGIFIGSESQTLRAGDEISKIMRVPSRGLPEEELMKEIRRFISGHRCLALATHAGSSVRCTPSEYLFLNDVFYIVTEGGAKFRGILDNGRVSAAIFDEETIPGRMTSLQLRGEAGAVKEGTEEYFSVMEAGHFSGEFLSDNPVTLFVIRITPLRYEFHDPSMETRACDIDQYCDTAFLKKHRKEGREYVSRERAKGQPTMKILGDDGKEREVMIPEISSALTETEVKPPERKRRTPAGPRREKKRPVKEDLIEQPLFDEEEEDTGKEKERPVRTRPAKEQKKSSGKMWARIGRMLQIDDEEEES